MDNIIFYAVAATVISLVVASLLIFLLIQRRRHRAMQLLAMAQEDAERRRRNRKKAGLRRWEIDTICPEAVFTHTENISSPRLYKLDDRPKEYISAVSHLPRTHYPTTPQPAHPSQIDVPPQAIVLPHNNHTCVICLDDLVVAQHVRALPCHHVYHAHCIRVWLRRKNACPCCCEKVIKRRKKKPLSTSLAPVRPVRRLDDREESSALDTSAQKAFPDEPDVSFDRVNSEASVQQDELSTGELLFQVRRALRGESSTISLNTSAADLEEAFTFRGVPEVPSFGHSSLDPEDTDPASDPPHQKTSTTPNRHSTPVEEKSDEVVIDLESTASTEYLTPPPEQLFLDQQQI